MEKPVFYAELYIFPVRVSLPITASGCKSGICVRAERETMGNVMKECL